MTYFTVWLRIPSTTVEELGAEDDINIAHEQQHIFVLPSALVLIPNLLSTNSKSFRCGLQSNNGELPLGDK